MYGGATQPERYCKITTYLQFNAPLLNEVIQNLCMFGMFNPRGQKGATYLVFDKKTQVAVDKMVGIDTHKAKSMIEACLLPVYLESIESFRDQQDDIPNMLGNKLPIKEVSSSSVTLSNGSKITKDSKFKRLYPNSNIAVYLIDGEVPTSGEKSDVFGKKNGNRANQGFSGGYSGGHDGSLSSGQYARGRSAYDWVFMVADAKKTAMLKAEHRVGGIDQLTHLSTSLINFLLKGGASNEAALTKLGELLCKVHPISPLYYLFVGCLLPEQVRQAWVSTPDMSYNNLETLKKHLAKGLYSEQKNIESKYKNKDEVLRLDATSICATVIRTAKNITDAHLGDYADTMNTYFGGVDHFARWVVLVSEFTFLYTGFYTKAYDNGDTKELQNIFDSYNRWVLPHVANNSNQFGKGLTLTNAQLANTLFSKEQFCTILSLFVSRRFFPVGSPDLDALAQKQSSTTAQDGAIYHGGNIAPNLIVPTSDEHTTAAFWVRTIND